MLKRENKQGDFFDSYVYDKLLPEKHVLLDIKKSIDFSFVDEQCKDLYSNSMGRPSFAPVVLFKILFLEFFCNLSDYEAVDQVQTNILYRYFVGLAISSPTPNHATLSVFRNRLSEKGFKKLFNRVVLQAQEKGLIEGKLKILDATHISASVTVQSAVNLLRHGRKTVIQKIEKTNARLAANMKLKYLNETKMYDTPSNQQVNEEIQLTKYFIKKVKKKSYDESTKDVIDLLETAVDQQSRKAKDKKYKQADEIVSLVDGDARRGAKSKTKKFMGYKAHASMDDKSNIVTSVRTISGNRNEGNKEETKYVIDILAPILGPTKEYCQTDAKTVELVKYWENTFYAMKVTFCNEMYEICEKMNINYWEARELWLKDPRVNKMHTAVFKDKRGYGGKCYPKDTNGLVMASKEAGYVPQLLEAMIDSNKRFKSKNI